ncbi:hypothetical protein Patl1_34329 [Pistacia atlantica]|uniref:Uncharacterized protein n=1 Tax=Pistacia atlantica TaxID=434234 RepID=A0ACC0ZRW5_9ROSI|nr:hypothetical protein Patl1_34329 [Pistacia atlantica]
MITVRRNIKLSSGRRRLVERAAMARSSHSKYFSIYS